MPEPLRIFTPHDCIFDETAACGEIRQRLKALEEDMAYVRQRSCDISNSIQNIELKLAEGRGFLRGGKAVVGLIGGIVGALLSSAASWLQK